MTTYTLGIDGSTTTTGYAICKRIGKKLSITKCGSIEASKEYKAYLKLNNIDVVKNKNGKRDKADIRKEMEWRIVFTINNLRKIIKSRRLDRVVIEDTYSSKDPDAYKWLCRLQGAVIEMCLEMDLPYVILAPSSWRSKCLIKQRDGRKMLKTKELKTNDISFAKDAFGIDFVYKENDKADAVCISAALDTEEMRLLKNKKKERLRKCN